MLPSLLIQSHRSTLKSRTGFSTLDPDLMMHPEALPRANTTSMTTEYSFLRTSVPRGPKLGSLGIPPAKERKSRSTRPSKIHSLADYKTPEPAGGSSGGGGVRTFADSSMGSLGSNLSSVSTLSENNMRSEVSSMETTSSEAQLGSSMSFQDISEVDAGSESGMGSRPGGDGNDSDSSTYSSVSTSTRGTGTYGMLAAAVGRQRGGNYTVEGMEIAPEAMGNFPSLQEVLQAASDEQHLLELEQDREGTGEPRSRRDSFSSR